MNVERLAARAVELLGPEAGPIAVEAPRVPRLAAAIAAIHRVATPEEAPSAAIVVFIGWAASGAERDVVLARLRDRLPPDAPLVVVDHNQPRTAWLRALALAPLLFAGQTPARARYPAARELSSRGFAIRNLRLADAERIQLISACRK